MQYIKVLEKRNVDELIVIDIEATKEGRLIDCDKIKEYTSQLFCPLTLGGGIKTLDDINKLLQSGADKVTIQTNYEIIPEASKKFGAQCIVYSMDVLPYSLLSRTVKDAKIWKSRGVGEILLTKTNYEGMMGGYDQMLIREISKAISIPIIINGGCGRPAHMKWALEHGASAVAASSMFLFTDVTPRDCAEYLKKEGVPVR